MILIVVEVLADFYIIFSVELPRYSEKIWGRGAVTVFQIGDDAL